MNDICFSIVTVTYNARDRIADTINSVINQTCVDYEYIVKDGGSTDGTVEYTEKLCKQFETKKIKYSVFSNPDSGIYDAMNQALEHCAGTWVIFMNAGDMFAKDNVLQSLLLDDRAKNYSCVYGNTINVKSGVKYIKKGYSMEHIFYRVPFIHQAAFIKLDIMNKYHFNSQYRIAADYDLYVRMFNDGCTFLYKNFNVAIFDMEGVSQTHPEESQQEVLEIQRKNGFLRRCRFKRFVFNNIKVPLKRNPFVYILYAQYKRVIGRN